VRHVAEPGAAVFLADGHSEQPEVAEFTPQIARKYVATVDLAGAWSDALLGKAPYLVAYRVDGLAEAEIEFVIAEFVMG